MRRLNLPSFFASRPGPAGSAERCDDRPIDDEDAAPSCGWYDSSNDLRRGLDVIEFEASPAWSDATPGGIMAAAAQAGAAA